jgi:hypothetical protein
MQYSSEGDYTGSRIIECHTGSATAHHNHPNEERSSSVDDFDIMSFMSVVTNFRSGTAEEATTLRLFAIYLGKWNMFHAHNQYRGQFFSVTLMPRGRLCFQQQTLS